MHATQAVHYLTQYFASPEQAVRGLSYLDDSAELLKIYRRFFPDEFARNTAPIRETKDLVATLEECLRLISERLFEIPYWYFDESAYEEGPLGYIPIDPMFGDWWNMDFEDLRPLWQVLLTLVGDVTPDRSEDEVIKQVLDARQRWWNQRIDHDKVVRLCRRQRGPLRHLHTALNAVYLDTGNPWFDTSYENPIQGIEWSVRNVSYLKKSWLEAQQACDHILGLEKWLYEETANIHRLLDLWSRGLAPQPT